MSNHTFCRLTLAQARDEARGLGVSIPKGLVALKSTKDSYFVQGVDDRGDYVSGCCAYDAKTRRIRSMIDEKTIVS